MLSDRSYMRDSYGRQTTSLLTWILCALVSGFLLQAIFERLFNSSALTDFLELSSGGLREGRIWTLVSYTLLHQGLLHILGNALGLYFFGRELITLLGEKRLVGFYLAAAAVGGLAWFGVNFDRSAELMGASSAMCAFLVLFACIYPNRQITFLAFFVIPVTLKPKYIACVAAAIDLCGFVFAELPGAQIHTGIAHSAHLGGMLVGLLYFHLVHQREWRTPDGRAEIELPAWFRRAQKPAAPPAPTKYKVNVVTKREDLRAEVDRILDKINSEGFGALTAEEKQLLDEAKDLLSRR